ncbi:DNA-processing protein DprA [Jeotgalibacillus salarius]|uniref:DNA-protecting protein DprA n=1 Tax=Jeotgalibacillus salarius TaxID=546023 RepID=A0A4Y8LJI6_9BACL|nr:DNA-processing protein DprA [Jeotgalibacillus salarius]TFE02745.1 DNA-protecting protein DprA [Jeotgalibacillus salarius]
MSDSQFKEKLLYLHYMNVLSNKQLLLWLQADPALERPLSNPPVSVKLTPHQSQKISSCLFSATYKEIESHLTQSRTSFITIFDELYPERLREIYDPPVILYSRGNINLLNNTNQLAVIGSRNADSYTERTLECILPGLMRRGVGIVSGMAKGADGIAHSLALGAETIGIIGSGFHYQYPRCNHDLYEAMIKKQLLLSEYPPYIKPQKFHFPMRNRIIAGISRGLLVTQAAIKSGTMITVDRALEEGRDVFAVPGPIFNILSEGTNSLINQGAKLTVSALDIIDEWRIK